MDGAYETILNPFQSQQAALSHTALQSRDRKKPILYAITVTLVSLLSNQVANQQLNHLSLGVLTTA